MSTLRVNNLKSRTGTAVTITSGHCLDVEGNLKIAGVSTFSAIASFTSGANVTGVVTFANVDIQNGNTNFTGIVSAKTFHGNITGTAATFTGAVTYEDVTNVDSVGVVTARTNLFVGAGVSVYGSTGIVSATKYYGDGSSLSGVDATTLKDTGGTTRVQATTSGAVTTGIMTATSFDGALPSGSVVAVHHVANGTRTDISTANAQTLTWGTFTKKRADTKLVYSGLIHTHNNAGNDSDASGLFISFESSSVSQVKKRHICRSDVTPSSGNFKERPVNCDGYISASDTNAAETYTVKWGTDTNSSWIATWWNPNNTDDARYNGQRESVLIIWEVMP